MIRTKSRTYQIYFYSIVLSGFGALGLAVYRLAGGHISYQWLILASCAALAGRFTVKIPGVKSKVSVADTFIFTNIILFGPPVGAITAGLEGFLGSLRSYSNSRKLRYLVFNIALMPLSAYVSGSALFWALGRPPLFGQPDLVVHDILLPIELMALVHYLINTAAVAIIIALEGQGSVFLIWRERFLRTSFIYFAAASVAALIVVNFARITPAAVGIALPMLLVTYVAYKAHLERAEENSHRQQIDKLYLKTVEALAVAIDARESGTLGQAKRVQTYARKLAKAMNISDQEELRGLESAALLLDIGNLAVPEYILNKPGVLTSSEFQKVMTHPVVGSNILSTVGFPFPVVDYVRHHHERWDGSGYPDRMQGNHIPLGARVLAAADCFVALTSDRPYQDARGNQEALKVMQSRAGTYYEPELVEKLAEVLEAPDDAEQGVQEIAPEGQNHKSSLSPGTREESPSGDLRAFKDISSAQKEVSAYYELTQSLGTSLSLDDTLATIVSQTGKILPYTTCVIYLYSDDNEALVARHVGGANSAIFKGYSISSVDSLSGWVAKRKEPSINASAARDLKAIKNQLDVALDSALVHPLPLGSKCLGTISLYMAEGSRFRADDLRLLASVSQKAAAAIHNAQRFEEVKEDSVRDPLTSLPNLRYLHQYVTQELAKARRYDYPLTILGMDLDGFKKVNDTYGHAAGDLMLVEIAKLLRNMLRVEDVIIRHGGDEFVAALFQTKRADALNLAARIQSALDSLRVEVFPGICPQVGVSIGCASFPEDGENLELLLMKADMEMYRDKESRTSARRLVIND